MQNIFTFITLSIFNMMCFCKRGIVEKIKYKPIFKLLQICLFFPYKAKFEQCESYDCERYHYNLLNSIASHIVGICHRENI